MAGAAEQRDRRDAAVEQPLHAAKQQTIGERQADIALSHGLLERLDGRVMAAGLVAH